MSPATFATRGRRRQIFSDRTWYGAGLTVTGLSASVSFGGGWFLFLLLLAVPGVALIWSGTARARSRVDPVTGRRRPGPPW